MKSAGPKYSQSGIIYNIGYQYCWFCFIKQYYYIF